MEPHLVSSGNGSASKPPYSADFDASFIVDYFVVVIIIWLNIFFEENFSIQDQTSKKYLPAWPRG